MGGGCGGGWLALAQLRQFYFILSGTIATTMVRVCKLRVSSPHLILTSVALPRMFRPAGDSEGLFYC